MTKYTDALEKQCFHCGERQIHKSNGEGDTVLFRLEFELLSPIHIEKFNTYS